MPNRGERRILLCFCWLVAITTIVAQDAEDLEVCAKRGREAGVEVAGAACLALKLMCPSLKSEAPNVRKSAEPEVLKGLLMGVVLDSCSAVFQEACRNKAVQQVLDSKHAECREILMEGPLEGLVDCPNVESAIAMYSKNVNRLCSLDTSTVERFKWTDRKPPRKRAPKTPLMLKNKTIAPFSSPTKSTPDEELVSRGRPTFQSTTIHGMGSSRAVDGKLSTRAFCTHTGFSGNKQDERTDNPWWSVDLGAARKVTRILITNRGDCCGDRLSNFEIRVGDSRPLGDGRDDAAVQNNTCQSGLSVSEGKTGEFFCGMRGRYVTVRIPGEGKILTLCEVRVYAEVDERVVIAEDVILSRNMPTFQSSTLWSGDSKRAVDNNKNADFSGKSCTHTGVSTQLRETWYPWWTVDLGKSRSIAGVRVTTRSDCCHNRLDNFEIRVGDMKPSGKGNQNPSCRSSLTIPRGETYQFDCETQARYVTIRIPRLAILTLCEVEVLGV